MKFKILHIISLTIITGLFVACNTTKHVPQGQYMVDKVSVNIDTKDISQQELTPFIRQQGNNAAFETRIYNWTYGSKFFLKKWISKLGKPPVIYDNRARLQSATEINTEMKNRGYLNANVTSEVDTVNKKAKITYHVTGNEPYRIRDYKIEISNEKVEQILERKSTRNRSKIKPGMIFDMYTLEEERSKVSELLRNRGYYTSTEDNLHYLADTTLRSHQVDLTMILKDSVKLEPYRIRKVSVFSGYDPLRRRAYHIKDSILYKDLHIYYDSTKFLRPGVLSSNILMRPGQLFSASSGNKTYTYLKDLNCISRVNIQYDEVMENDSAALDCKIYLTPGNIHNIQTGLEGTNKAGDLGIAANVSYTQHNIFNGSEVLGIKLRGAYEFVNRSASSNILNHNFYEFGIGATLGFSVSHIPFASKLSRNRFKINSEYGISFDIQNRPEYIREFFNLSWRNKWHNESKTINQTLNLLDINYVMMPWISEDFETYLDNQGNKITKFSYENVFTAGIGYSLIVTNNNTGKYRQKLHTVRLNFESSGNLLEGIFKLANAEKSGSGQYNILGNPFAQYVKGDIDFSETQRVSGKGSIAYRAGIGIAYPYENSTILPFEKRYYAGGPNNVRGWDTRYLGPGSYHADIGNPSTHVGDINLIMSFEYRYKILKWLELAAFADSGNIWTIKEYENQPGGMFNSSTFYKELAIGTGIGVRLDLSFLIVRLDSGKKVYDPAREEGQRWVFLDKFKGNWGIYLAIGYPF